MATIKSGDKVRMTEEYKRMGLIHSPLHIKEFGDCVGIVEDLVNYNSCDQPFELDKLGPEWNVRWQIRNGSLLSYKFRYAYHPDNLEIVED